MKTKTLLAASVGLLVLSACGGGTGTSIIGLRGSQTMPEIFSAPKMLVAQQAGKSTEACTDECASAALSTQESIDACFSTPGFVSYAMDDSKGARTRLLKQSIEPVMGTQSPRAVVQTQFFDDGSSRAFFWNVTPIGVVFAGRAGRAKSSLPSSIALDMQPGESIQYQDKKNRPTSMTFIGFESVTLADATFSGVCHFQVSHPNTSQGSIDAFFAPNYGEILESFNDSRSYQYSAMLDQESET